MPQASEPSAPQGESVAGELEKRMGQLRESGSQQPHMPASQTLSNFVFDQTEYVHSFLALTRKKGKNATKEQLPFVFDRCLLSYDTVMVFLKGEIKTSPDIIFTHAYFQFCLLALCRPFVEYSLDVGGVSPREICVEVLQTILDLTESYAKLFTLRQTPCFIPYFVFAAGLTRIAFGMDTRTARGLAPDLQGMGSSSEPNALSWESLPQPDVADETGEMYIGGMDDGPFSQPPSGPMTNDSNAPSWCPEDHGEITQAVRQLDAMSSGHSAASQACWVLRDFKPDPAHVH
ncbi:hypothetical protein GE09DRAFT_465569 [Coniochaeta sp. 2T2.1]|nr:hypothetical protein GE09DRAFT_465569 [Coniochaeta sp. 2T2.1]